MGDREGRRDDANREDAARSILVHTNAPEALDPSPAGALLADTPLDALEIGTDRSSAAGASRTEPVGAPAPPRITPVEPTAPPAPRPIPRAAAARSKRTALELPSLRLLALLSALAAAGVIAWEMHTSVLESRWFTRYARHLGWTVQDGACPNPLPPQQGPYDKRLGYSRLPEMQKLLAGSGFVVARQACPTPELAALGSHGVSPPYDEKDAGSVVLLDSDGNDLYRAPLERFHFGSYDELPPLVVQSLLYIENRHLLDGDRTTLNPAVEWERLFLAGSRYTIEKLLHRGYTVGGSTLATQLEKFRHSPEGRTAGAGDKARQMLAASLRVYAQGRDTHDARRDIVVKYVNSMPLGAVPGTGEINGLGEGMWAWFGKTQQEMVRDLDLPESGAPLERKAETYKQALALVLATRRPNVYLQSDRAQLVRRMQGYIKLMQQDSVITPQLAQATLAAPLRFRAQAPALPAVAFVDRKATNAVRAELLDMLDVPSLYDLDRYDLRVETGIDSHVQEQVTGVLRQLHDPEFLSRNGFYGEHLLGGADPKRILYSFSLYESTPRGNRMRVQADNLEQPLDINRDVKLELGSTAKLRTMANYLMVIASLHERHHASPRQFAGRRAQADPITAWSVAWLRRNPDAPLQDMLQASLERELSASTGETFFTGGGQHHFVNFDKKWDGTLSLRVAFQNSVNLVYIRLMRELVQYYQARLGYDPKAIFADATNAQRRELLAAGLDHEAREHLYAAYKQYKGMRSEDALRELCGAQPRALRRLAIFYLTEHPDATVEDLAREARRVFPEAMRARSEAAMRRHFRSYAGRIHNSQDEAYLLDCNPLEVWRVRDLRQHPDATWDDIVQRSAPARREASAWIQRPRFKRKQDARIRSELERRAFVEIHTAWKALGYPFDALVPSLATAIGSSGDRPQALAELVGIIQNGGVHTPFMPVEALHFGEGTPYETRFEPDKGPIARLMPAEVAGTLKDLMHDVVEEGTGRRVQGVLHQPDGEPIAVGGKTGSGDNRYQKFASNGGVIGGHAINRTASFVFVVGDRFFGMVSACVLGKEAAQYRFTSSLALQAFKTLAPVLEPMIVEGETGRPYPDAAAAARSAAAGPLPASWRAAISRPTFPQSAIPRPAILQPAIARVLVSAAVGPEP